MRSSHPGARGDRHPGGGLSGRPAANRLRKTVSRPRAVEFMRHMRRGENNARFLRALVIAGILAGLAGAVFGAVGAVSGWRQDARRDTVAQLIADARFAVAREQALLQDVPTSRKQR